jgi:hypothetical protein
MKKHVCSSKFCMKLWAKSTHTLKMLQIAFSDETLSCWDLRMNVKYIQTSIKSLRTIQSPIYDQETSSHFQYKFYENVRMTIYAAMPELDICSIWHDFKPEVTLGKICSTLHSSLITRTHHQEWASPGYAHFIFETQWSFGDAYTEWKTFVELYASMSFGFKIIFM